MVEVGEPPTAIDDVNKRTFRFIVCVYKLYPRQWAECKPLNNFFLLLFIFVLNTLDHWCRMTQRGPKSS